MYLIKIKLIAVNTQCVPLLTPSAQMEPIGCDVTLPFGDKVFFVRPKTSIDRTVFLRHNTSIDAALEPTGIRFFIRPKNNIDGREGPIEAQLTVAVIIVISVNLLMSDYLSLYFFLGTSRENIKN